MLAELQRQLTAVYGLRAPHDVRDFLITDPMLAKILGQDALLANTEETLLVVEEDDGLAMSLFLDGGMLERLESDSPLDRLHLDHLDDFCKVLEGISHFNCMSWKARREREVSLLELELQGEIDKFVSAMLLAHGQDNDHLQRELHGCLFEDVRFRDDLDDDARARYEEANEYAARYCHGMRHRWQSGEPPVNELRQFFRLQLADKISFIHARA